MCSFSLPASRVTAASSAAAAAVYYHLLLDMKIAFSSNLDNAIFMIS